MSVRQRGTARSTRHAWLTGAAAAAGIIFSAPGARAQGFFDNIFGGFDERPAASARPTAPAGRATQAPTARWQSSDERYRGGDWFSPEPRASVSAPAAPRTPTRSAKTAPPRARLTVVRRAPADAEEDTPVRAAPSGERRAASAGSSGGAFCVRMCDGRYFPLSQAVSDGEDAASTCNALCPAAKTKVFRGSEPEDARASDGTRYRELPVAFVFREKIVADCSCTGHGSGGLASLKLEADPTLQAGDVAMTRTGLMAFKGASRFPYRTADFTPVGSYARLSADLRRTLANIKPDTTAQPMPVAIPVVAATEEASAKKGKAGRSRAQSAVERQASID